MFLVVYPFASRILNLENYIGVKDPYRTIKAGDLPFICKFYSFESETTRALNFNCLFNFSRKTEI